MPQSENTRLREVFVPFLYTAIGVIIIYSVFRWLFDVKFNILPFNYDVINFLIPLVVTIVAVHVLLRKRIRILKVDGKHYNGYFAYEFVFAAAIFIPLMVSQYYLERSSYDLFEVHSATEIPLHPNEKYFKIKTFTVDRDGSLPYTLSRVSGKTNENLTYYLFISSPFVDADDVWYGLEFNEHLSNRLSDARKEWKYNSFIEESLTEFEAYNFQRVEYFEQLRNSTERDGFVYAITEKFPEKVSSDQIILVPHREPFEERTGFSLFWIFGSLGIAALVVYIMTLVPDTDVKELKKLKNGVPLQDDFLKSVMEILNPLGKYKGTSWLLIINTLVLIVMMFHGVDIIHPSARLLLEYGGNRRLEVLDGEYWRLLTAVFLHGGVFHLVLNLFGLGLSGFFLEKTIGSLKLIISFLICGILASVASIYWNVNVVSIGASGAIYGLLGILLIFNLSSIYPEYESGFLLPVLLMYTGSGIFMGLIAGYDNAAHIGGLISGIILGGIFILMEREKLNQNTASRPRRKKAVPPEKSPAQGAESE